MKERNPFLLRTLERIQSDSDFLRLFSPKVLEAILNELPIESLWNQFFTFQSSPGGGKTSVFKVFTPSPLVTLCEMEETPERLEELYQCLLKINAISEGKPALLGVYLSCSRNYDTLEDLKIDSIKKERLFYTLLNARILVSTLKSALVLKGLSFPKDLKKIKIKIPLDIELPPDFPLDGIGDKIYSWASNIEKNIYKEIDGFTQRLTYYHDNLYSLLILKRDNILFENNPITDKLVIMLDDVHQLTIVQREKLRKAVIELRPPIGIWFAERLKALSPAELFPSGSIQGRDYIKTINLEKIWREGSSKNFEKVLLNIAEKRVISSNVETQSFVEYLKSSQSDDTKSLYPIIISKISDKIKKKYGNDFKYSSWIKVCESASDSIYDSLLQWKKIEILIERESKKDFSLFEGEYELSEEELDERSKYLNRNIFEFLLYKEFRKEFQIPYYFGFNKLVYLSSSNIQQFLSFSARLFEEIISAKLINKDPHLSADRQESILKNAAEERWLELKRIPYGENIIKLIQSISAFAIAQDEISGFPYPPGITGIAITMEDRLKLINSDLAVYRKLRDVLASCISNNVFEVILDYVQGGKTNMVLYLNRWICLKFGLTVYYGGWRRQNLETLVSWTGE